MLSFLSLNCPSSREKVLGDGLRYLRRAGVGVSLYSGLFSSVLYWGEMERMERVKKSSGWVRGADRPVNVLAADRRTLNEAVRLDLNGSLEKALSFLTFRV